jgi:hypothetical protein
MSDYHWELVVFREMAELHIVVCISDVENDEDSGTPLLDSDEPSLSKLCGISRNSLFLQEMLCKWEEILWGLAGLRDLGTSLRDDHQDSEWTCLCHDYLLLFQKISENLWWWDQSAFRHVLTAK